MDELLVITQKYDAQKIKNGFTDLASLNALSFEFFADVAEIYECITRLKNAHRNPTGFDLHDAPILGLLVRIWKLMKEVLGLYIRNNAQLIGTLERPLVEAAVVAEYLLSSEPSVIEDYRKCSYKNRLRILRDVEAGTEFSKTKAGQRLAASIRKKLSHDGFSADEFGEQETRKWKVQGKSFRDMFKTVAPDQLYPAVYGMMSESIHGSWNDSLDFDLYRDSNGTFSANPFSSDADVRFVCPTILFTNRPFKLWLDRIEVKDRYLNDVFNWIDNLNNQLFLRFDQIYGE